MAGAGQSRIRVTFVLPSFAGGGAERVVLTLVRHLDRARFMPDLVVLNDSGPLRDTVPPDVTITNLERARLRDAWPRLGAALVGDGGDVIVPTISHINLAVLKMRTRFRPGTRVVVRESNTPSASLSSTRWPRLFRWLYRIYCPRADAVLCPSRRVAAEFERDFRIDPDRLTVLPHPVDVDAVRGPAEPVRREAGPGPRFVAAGRLTRQKGFDRLIDLMPTLGEDAHLTILGEGEDREALQAQARDSGVADRIALPGFQENPWAWFAGADAFLLPSRWEGMPNAALEALAAGTPVIASAEAGGVTEIDAAGGALTIVDSGDEFAEAMRRVAPRSGTGLRPSLLPARFGLDGVMAEFEALLHRVVAGPRPHP